jgi:hypothetical protein
MFLFVFDVNSTTERKNPGAVIDAFKCAFHPSDRARLVIKCVNGSANRRGIAALVQQIGEYPVSLIDGYWPADRLRDLTAACDAYVSLHRSEGLGLTITEAMAHGKPVVATGWSGNTDVMHAGNSFPIDYRLVDIPASGGIYSASGRWAEPSIEHAARIMRSLYQDRNMARAVGAAARRDIERDYSEQAIADLVQARLHAIAIRQRWPAFKRKMHGVSRGYWRMVRQTIVAVRNAVPPDAKVAVVSKGDAALLAVPGRLALHFPQLESGVYAGHYPADSAEAIAHLEQLRTRGADHFVLPRAAFWWLDYYTAFAQHLNGYEVVSRNTDCLIYSLTERRSSTEPALHHREERT